jgi:hypothetical protein
MDTKTTKKACLFVDSHEGALSEVDALSISLVEMVSLNLQNCGVLIKFFVPFQTNWVSFILPVLHANHTKNQNLKVRAK